MENNIAQKPHSSIHVIGTQVSALRNFFPNGDKLTLLNTSTNSHKWINPQSFASHNGLVALIDQKNDLWVFDNHFAAPLNITDILKMKAKRVFVGEGQLIFQNKRKGWVLVNWNGKVDLDVSKMRKVSLHQSAWNNSIDAYFVDQQCEQGSLWYYSSIKKLQNNVKIYLLNSQHSQIIGFPSRKIIQLPQKIAGVSLGKYHALCWTVTGRLFCWGNKNLALGLKSYSKSYYDEAQEISIKQPIFKAIASTNYSLALGVDGNLYQWGISILGEPILTPRPLLINNKRFLDIKGFESTVVGLTSANELCVWGKGTQRYVNRHEGKINQNVYIISKQKNVKIYDYNLEESCIIALIGKQDGRQSKDQKYYFAQVVRKVSQKWLPHRIKEPAISLSRFKQCGKENQQSVEIMRKNEDYIDRLICNQLNKEQYFSVVKNEEVMFRKIMQEKSARHTAVASSIFQFLDTKDTLTKAPKSGILKCHRKVESARQTPNITLDIEASNKMIREYEHEQVQSRNRRRKCKMAVSEKREHLKYESRLEAVLLKRCKMQSQRKAQKMQILQKKLSVAKRIQPNKSHLDSHSSNKLVSHLHTYITKLFLCQLLRGPVQTGRQIKIQQIVKQIPNQISENISNMLYKNRAIALLKNLMSVEPKKYEVVAKVLVRAIHCFRNKKDKKYRRDVVKEMVRMNISNKIKYKLTNIYLQTRKIQKIAKWLAMEQKQRAMQLKMLWKKSLLLYLKPTPSFQTKRSSIYREELNYKVCHDKIRNPRLATYISNSPICKLKLMFQAPITLLHTNNFEPSNNSSYLESAKDLSPKKGVSWAENEISNLKLESSIRDERKSGFSSGTSEILLYSHHYDCFYKPKNYQINIPEGMKHSLKWVTEERRILNKMVKEILYAQWRQYWSERVIYEQKLAYFIKENYEALTEFRWKYLIEYNKIKDESSLAVIKKERELVKLLSIINAQNILLSDVLPQKHKILEHAKLMKGSPTPPSLDVALHQHDFKKNLKNYYQNVSNKAKHLRKFYA